MKKNFIFLGIFFSMIFLSSCGNQNTDITQTGTEKQNFSIQTAKLSEFGADISQEKTAVIQANSTLEIMAESSGKISKILVKEGQKIQKGATIATIEDSLNNYDLALRQAENNISMQKANNEAQIVNLDNAIISAEMQYKSALQNYNHLIGRNDLKYDNLVKQNKDTLKTYNDSYKNHLTTLDAMMTQYLHDADLILGMTHENQHRNNSWEMYLGAASGIGFGKAEDKWNELYALRGAVRARGEEKKTFTESDTVSDIQILEKGYTGVREFSDAMIEMIQNSVLGGGLSMEMQNGWLQQWNGFRNGIQASETQFIAWKTQVNTFLENYKKNELAIRLANSSEIISAKDFNDLQNDSELQLAYKNADLETKQSIDNAKIALEQAETMLENAKKSKLATEKQFATSLQSAEIGLMQASRNASKLFITAPISGTITKIIAEVGQSVNNGSTIVEFAGSEAEATIEIDPRMALFMRTGDEISAKVGEKKITGTIVGVSPIAGKNLLSSLRIAFKNASDFIGQAAVVSLKIPENFSAHFLLPINSVKIIAEGQGEIQTLQNGKIISEKVHLGAMYGASIEILTELSTDTEVIMSDVSTFNENTQILQITHFSQK